MHTAAAMGTTTKWVLRFWGLSAVVLLLLGLGWGWRTARQWQARANRPLSPAAQALDRHYVAAWRDPARPVRQGLVVYQLTDFAFVRTLGQLRPGPYADARFLVVNLRVRNFGRRPVRLDSTTLMLTENGTARLPAPPAARAALLAQAGGDTTAFATCCPAQGAVSCRLVFAVVPGTPSWLYHLWLGNNTQGLPPVYVNCYEDHREGG